MKQFLGITERGFHWKVTLKNQTFNYYMGLGHSKLPYEKDKARCYVRDFKKTRNVEGYHAADFTSLSLDDRDKILKVHNYATVLWNHDMSTILIKKPKYRDVIYSLALDADSGNRSFWVFCDDFGLSVDSREALKTYFKCQETHQKLSKMRVDIDRILRWDR